MDLSMREYLPPLFFSSPWAIILSLKVCRKLMSPRVVLAVGGRFRRGEEEKENP